MIRQLDFKKRALLLARLANTAYRDVNWATRRGHELGFSSIKFYDRDGAQAYRFDSEDDIVIACRGTEPTEWNDISADLKALLVAARLAGRVHVGFRSESDELYSLICDDLRGNVKNLWFCGHSLGAAMATIMASRCELEKDMPAVSALFTYGSPRVGNGRFVRHLQVEHHRFVRNNDIVTRVPLWTMGYRHDGIEHYIDSDDKVRQLSRWDQAKDRLRGLYKGALEGDVDAFSDHSMIGYVKALEGWAE